MAIGYTGRTRGAATPERSRFGLTELRSERRFERSVASSPAPRAEAPAPAPTPSPAAPASRRYGRRALALDLTMLALVAAILTLISPTDSPTGSVPREPLVWALALPAAIIGMFRLQGMYSAPLRLDFMDGLRLVVTGAALAAISVMTLRVVASNEAYVAAETVRHWLLAIPFLAGGRGALMWAETRARRDGATVRPTLIVGSGRVGRLTARRLLGEPELGLKPIAFFDDDPLAAADVEPHLPVFGSDRDLAEIVAEHSVRHVIIAFSNAPHEQLLELARRCWTLGVTVSVVPRLFEIQGEHLVMEHLGGLPLMELRPANPNSWKFSVKYALDRVVAAVALVVISPVMLAAMLGVRLTMGAPVFYRQRRVGRDGHTFDMLKFRTMSDAPETGCEADADWAAEQLGGEPATADDAAYDRVTPVGAVLRRFSIDELPQLFNVLRGEMSLVGPRPERVNYVERFEGDIYRYADRHRVKAGLTGWAQVNGLRGRTGLGDRIEWDNHYIENWSPWLDFKILMATIPCLLRGQGE
jgi:exopolysaccharide biosynthesis polyprenyl glycosylphosphotransferase